jgi:hypothetical protein
MGPDSRRPAVQLSLEPDCPADQDGQHEGRPVQMLELLRDQGEIHGGEIGTCAARVEVNPERAFEEQTLCGDLHPKTQPFAIGSRKTATRSL